MNTKKYIAGADEVGWGAWAGMLVVVGVRAPTDWIYPGLKDSKKMSPKRRQKMSLELDKLIVNGEITWALAERAAYQIDEMGAAAALHSCYYEVFSQLADEETLLIADGNLKFDSTKLNGYMIQSVVKADDKYPAVSAASILAKVYRDTKMKMLAKQYPVYDWENNVGYHSATHVQGLEKHGACPLHRFSYAPIKKYSNKLI